MLSKEELLQNRLSEAEVEIPGLGSVRVRGMSRYEFMVVQRIMETKGYPVGERYMLHLCLVEPALTEDEAALLVKGSPAGELAPVTEKIRELSGIQDTSAKEAYKSVRS